MCKEKRVRTMGRPSKECVRVSYSLDKQIADSLDRFCNDTGRTKTKVVEMAITEFIEKYGNEPKK